MTAIAIALGKIFNAKVIKTILIIFFIYCFCGVLSFVFFGAGFFINIFTFPLNFIDRFFYPVSGLPYLFLYGGFLFILAMLLVRLFKH